MNFNPLKRIVKSTFNHDPIEQVFWGSPTGETYTKVLTNYRMMPTQMRQQVIARCLRKLAKPKEAEQVIANLALIQKIMKIDFVYMPVKEPDVIQVSKKKEVSMAEKNFIRFYFQFLRMEQTQLPNKLTTIEDKLNFCQTAMSKCLLIINHNIYIDYCLSHSPNQTTLRIALKEIFQDCRKDLQITISFIESNAKLIYEENSPVSFAINEVYETLIFVSKSVGKITGLVKKAGLGVAIQVYRMDKELNMRIEMEMNARRDEKMKFKTEKCIRSRKQIEHHEDHHYGQKIEKSYQQQKKQPNKQRLIQSLSEIDEDDILILSEQPMQ